MVTAKLGNTRYELRETQTPGVLCVTRHNSEGEATFYFPVTLVVGYMAAKMRATVAGKLDAFFNEVVAGPWGGA